MSLLILYRVIVVLLVQGFVECDDFLAYGAQKAKFLTLEGLQSHRNTPHVTKERSSRFLTFNNDESNIRIEMVFAVPFLHIPIGSKTVEGPYGNGVSPVVDVNAKSLITASVLLFMLFFVIPKLVRVFIPTSPKGRAQDESESEWERVLRGVENSLHVNSTACWQQSVCSLVQVGKDSPGSWGRLLDTTISSKWMEKLAAGTSLGEAMVSARTSERGCESFYSQCPLSPDKLGNFAKELSRRYMNHLIQLSNTRNGVK